VFTAVGGKDMPPLVVLGASGPSGKVAGAQLRYLVHTTDFGLSRHECGSSRGFLVG